MESWTFQSIDHVQAHSENQNQVCATVTKGCEAMTQLGGVVQLRVSVCVRAGVCELQGKKTTCAAEITKNMLSCLCFLHMTKIWCVVICSDWLSAREILRGANKPSVIKTSPLISVHFQRLSQLAYRLLRKSVAQYRSKRHTGTEKSRFHVVATCNRLIKY